MPRTDRLTILCKMPSIAWFDLMVLAILFIGGAFYLHDSLYWGVGWVGDTQYGDAEFWWNGALHVAQGIFSDNPGKGFRPGYFILTGFVLPVLGVQFKQFFPYFLLLFLSSASLLYVALRQSFGKWVAACSIAMLVFNPFTAEWLATSTTDGTGLLLNIAALACLLLGVKKELKWGWLAAFGVLFALATLTRPLMTPFIGIVILALFLLPQITFKQRLRITICILLAFSIPTALWMVMQKVTIDRWAISSNDASAFYAASDPSTQVWNGGPMYDHIQQIAAQHFHVKADKVNDQMLNQIFWRESIKNYIQYPSYHFSRLFPHVWQIAHFSPKRATHGTDLWHTIFFELIVFGLSIMLWVQQKQLRIPVLIALGISIYLLPKTTAIMTIAGAIIAIQSIRKKRFDTFFLGAYWIVGVIALYLVGGTWGKPTFANLDLNALGYRLGSQVFFAGDLLAAYFLVFLAHFKNKEVFSVSYSRVRSFILTPSSLAGGMVFIFFGLFLSAVMMTYVVGACIVGQRIYARHHKSIEAFPSVEPVKKVYQASSGYSLVRAISDKGGLNPSIFSQRAVKNGAADIIFTGTVSAFVWNLPGQSRAQLMVHAQDQVYPYTMGPGFILLEVPEHVRMQDWVGQQGAFVIRQTLDHHNLSNLPYYLTTPAIRAFFPLAPDKHSFLLSKAIGFPLVENATQLEATSDLHIYNAKVTWAQDSGQIPYQRRFFISPQSNNQKIRLVVNVQKIKKPAMLTFSYVADNIPGKSIQAKSVDYYDVLISSINKGNNRNNELLTARESIHPIIQEDALRKIQLSVPADSQLVEINFKNLGLGKGVWVYEFNVSTDLLMAKKLLKKHVNV